jgi:hypothetical protein
LVECADSWPVKCRSGSEYSFNAGLRVVRELYAVENVLKHFLTMAIRGIMDDKLLCISIDVFYEPIYVVLENLAMTSFAGIKAHVDGLENISVHRHAVTTGYFPGYVPQGFEVLGILEIELFSVS